MDNILAGGRQKTLYNVTVEAIDLPCCIYLKYTKTPERPGGGAAACRWRALRLMDPHHRVGSFPYLFRHGAANLVFDWVVIEKQSQKIHAVGPHRIAPWRPNLADSKTPITTDNNCREAISFISGYFIEHVTSRLQWRAYLLAYLRQRLATTMEDEREDDEDEDDENSNRVSIESIRKMLASTNILDFYSAKGLDVPAAQTSLCDYLQRMAGAGETRKKKRKTVEMESSLEAIVMALRIDKDMKKLVPRRELKQCVKEYFTEPVSPITKIKMKCHHQAAATTLQDFVNNEVLWCRLYLVWNRWALPPHQILPVSFCDRDAVWWPHMAPRITSEIYEHTIVPFQPNIRALTQWLEWIWVSDGKQPSQFASAAYTSEGRRLIEMIERLLAQFFLFGLDDDDDEKFDYVQMACNLISNDGWWKSLPPPSSSRFPSAEVRATTHHIQECLWRHGPLLCKQSTTMATILYLLYTVWYGLKTLTIVTDAMDRNRTSVGEARETKGSLMPPTCDIISINPSSIETHNIDLKRLTNSSSSSSFIHISLPSDNEAAPPPYSQHYDNVRRRLNIVTGGTVLNNKNSRLWVCEASSLQTWAVLGQCWLVVFPTSPRFKCNYVAHYPVSGDIIPLGSEDLSQYIRIYDQMMVSLINIVASRRNTADRILVYLPEHSFASFLVKATPHQRLYHAWLACKKQGVQMATRATISSILIKGGHLIDDMVIMGMETMSIDELLTVTAALTGSAASSPLGALRAFCSGGGGHKKSMGLHVISCPVWAWNPKDEGASPAHLVRYFGNIIVNARHNVMASFVPDDKPNNNNRDGAIDDIMATLQAMTGGGGGDDEEEEESSNDQQDESIAATLSRQEWSLTPENLRSMLLLGNTLPPPPPSSMSFYRVDWSYRRSTNMSAPLLSLHVDGSSEAPPSPERYVYNEAVSYLLTRRPFPSSIQMGRRDWINNVETRCFRVPILGGGGGRYYTNVRLHLPLRTTRRQWIHPAILFNRIIIHLPQLSSNPVITLVHHETYKPLADPMAELTLYCNFWNSRLTLLQQPPTSIGIELFAYDALRLQGMH